MSIDKIVTRDSPIPQCRRPFVRLNQPTSAIEITKTLVIGGGVVPLPYLMIFINSDEHFHFNSENLSMWCKNGPGELYIQLTEEESSAGKTWRGRNLESLESLIRICNIVE
jgi:hypothetical protein